MKVLHVAPYAPPARVGGVGVYVLRLHRALRAAGHDSRVWTRAPGQAAVEDAGVRTIAASRAGWFAALAARAAAAARHDIVHVHAGEALPLLVGLRLRPDRPRVVATWHAGSAELARAERPYRLEGQRFAAGGMARLARTARGLAHRGADRLALPLVDDAVAISRAVACEALGEARAAGTTVIHHGVPMPAETVGDRALAHRELLYVGVAGHRKRVHALPFVLARVRAARPGARLRIAGFAAEDVPSLCAAFAARGLGEAVDWAGALAPESLAHAYRAADVLLAPAACEGVPLAVIEAMQHGLPVVATRIPGHLLALAGGDCGVLVPVDDPPAMAAQCIALLRSPARRRALGEAAAKSAGERFAMERHVRAHLRLYETLLRDPR